MKPYLDYLRDLPFGVYLGTLSALDLYFRKKNVEKLNVFAETNLVEIAKNFTTIDYPGSESTAAIVTI